MTLKTIKVGGDGEYLPFEQSKNYSVTMTE